MNRNRISVLLFLFLAGATLEAQAQVNGKSLAERLGFARDAKLLIVHADDVGMTHSMGLRPTHFDSHQYRLYENGKDLFEVVLRLAHDYKLPVFVARDWFADHPYLESSLTPADIVLDHTVTIDPAVPPEKWADFYK